MRKKLIIATALVLFTSAVLDAQPIAYHRVSSKNMLAIIKAEDELRFDGTLKRLLRSPNEHLRKRTALALGRIGDPDAVKYLSELMNSSSDGSMNRNDVRQMAAFALGEVESIDGADSIIAVLDDFRKPSAVRARAVEAAGKIAAANAKHEKSKKLGKAIIRTLEFEANSRSKPNREAILLGLTAALRAKPDGAERTIVKFLGYSDWRIRADALNTLARLSAKNANDKARKLLKEDKHPIVRAKAARVLGAAGDKSSVGLLMKAAVGDEDLRVRVNAVRALSGLKDPKSAEVLLDRAEKLLVQFKGSKAKNPVEKNELLTVISALGNILKGTESKRAASLLREFRVVDYFRSPESEVALAKISPETYTNQRLLLETDLNNIERLGQKPTWRFASNVSAGLAELAKLPVEKANRRTQAFTLMSGMFWFQGSKIPKSDLASQGILRAYASFMSENDEDFSTRILSKLVKYRMKPISKEPSSLFSGSLKVGYFEPFIRATAASLLGDRKPTKENIEALKLAFKQALEHDTHYDDAQLAILSALVKLDKNEAKESLNLALDHYAFLVRRQAAKLIKDNGLTGNFPNLKARVGTVKKYDPKNNSKLGQVTNSEADYKRAISRKNGNSKAVLLTDKGEFTINFFPEQAPLTVDNFIRLADSGYFNGVEIHRVVPNFVVQDGDPRGDGNGGPGWQIRCEINQIPYERGMVGMALSGKDTGGSQWFVTHAPQPHLDGGYTIFGKVNEKDMKVVDNLVRGDNILGVMIIEKETNAGY